MREAKKYILVKLKVWVLSDDSWLSNCNSNKWTEQKGNNSEFQDQEDDCIHWKAKGMLRYLMRGIGIHHWRFRQQDPSSFSPPPDLNGVGVENSQGELKNIYRLRSFKGNLSSPFSWPHNINNLKFTKIRYGK